MAVAYQSISTAGLASTGGGSAAHSLVITKPSGLAAGDLMVAIAGSSNQGDFTHATTGADVTMSAAGWTKLNSVYKTDQSPDSCLGVYYKTATSGDAAATDFTIWGTHSLVVAAYGGAILRFSDAIVHSSYSDFDSTQDTNPTTVTVSGGVTPVVANNILILAGFLGSSDNANTLSVSNYAVATSSPTWTERWDTNKVDGNEAHSIFVATGPRTQTTATGNYSFDVAGDAGGDVIYGAVCLIAVQTPTAGSVSPDPITLAGSVQAPTVIGAASIAPDPVLLTLSIPTATAADVPNTWTETSKNSTTWTETSK